MGHSPRKAECFTWDEWEFEVVDVDRNRVDQDVSHGMPCPAGQKSCAQRTLRRRSYGNALPTTNHIEPRS
ncbi:MAG: hypothetical protein Q8Q28_08835 [Pseudomonadota bacterium]|nr:hypothetical protein [Pseudomonadota bacterium]